MILYSLRCEGGHAFEAWFRSSADFDRQAEIGLIECVTCGSHAVTRGLMAPALVGQARAPTPGASETAASAAPSVQTAQSTSAAPSVSTRAMAGAPMPDAMRALLSRMRSEIERHCEDVGRDFADEALRMHRGEVEHRGIYGEATETEREALADEGVEIARIPWLPRSES